MDASTSGSQEQNPAFGDITIQGDITGASLFTFNQTQIIQVAVAEIKTRPLKTTSPYKGLKKFEPEDKDYFFGRDQFLTGLVNELEQTSLVLLLGASGSGKSSVVRAGLIPWLLQKWGNHFVNLMFTPDQDPFESFYGSLLSRGFKQSEAKIAKEEKVETLSQVVKTLKQPDDFWLIFIDQFEELFTTCEPQKCDHFIESLVKLTQTYDRDSQVKIVATMRSDFSDRFDPHPASLLARVTEKHRPMITQLHPDELRLAIEQPAAQHGVVFEPGLVEDIIKDVQGQAGYLPLLQYTLNLLWETEEQSRELDDRALNRKTYRQLGGIRGALQLRVDQIYDALPEPEQLAVQRIFLKLVEIGRDVASGSEWKPVRRRAARSEFSDEVEQRVLTQLIDANLLVSDAPLEMSSDRNSSSQPATVEIAHEVLLTSWQTLNGWIEENRQAIALRNRLNEDVVHWQAGKAESELWRGSKLEQAAEFLDDPTFNQVVGGFSEAACQFIKTSVGLRERRRRRTIFGLTGVSVVLLLIASFAGIQWRKAEIGQIEALTQASSAKFTENRDSLAPLIDAIRAGERLQRLPWRQREQPLQADVMTVLRQAIFWIKEKNRLARHTGFVQSVRFSPDGQTLATASFDNTAKLWGLDGQILQTFKGHTDNVTNVSISSDSDIIATSSFDKTARLWNRQGKLLHILQGHAEKVWDVSFSPDDQVIATASDDETVKFWNLQGELLPTELKGQGGGISSVSFSPDGKLIATANDDGTVELWGRNGARRRTLSEHDDYVLHVIFSPDGQLLATASTDRTVLLWNVNDLDATPIKLEGHTLGVTNVAFSPDGELIATASFDGRINLWNRQGRLQDTLNGHDGRVTSVSFQPEENPLSEGSLLASAGNDKTARLWKLDLSRGSVLMGHELDVFAVSFSPDSQILATSGFELSIMLWNARGERRPISTTHADLINDISISPNGQVIASASRDTTAQLRKLDGTFIAALEGHTDSVLSVSFSSDSQEVATSSYDRTVKLWNLNGELIKTIDGHKAGVRDVNFSPDGNHLITASEDGTAILWSHRGKLIRILDGHDGPVYRSIFSPNSQMILTSGEDNTARLWSKDGKLLQILREHSASIWGIDISPNGQLIATASDDKTVKLWSINGELITTLAGHIAEVNSVEFSADSFSLATGSSDSRVILWNISHLTVKKLLNTGCNWINDYRLNSLLTVTRNSYSIAADFCNS